MNWFSWALLSALFAGLTAILAKVGVAGVNSNLATAIRTTVVLAFTWGIALATSKPAAMFELSRRTWIFLALSGMATGEASRVAPVDKLSIVFVIALAALFLHERLTWHQWVGGGLVVAGAVVLAWK